MGASVGAVLAVAVVGTLDAVFTGDHDLAVLFGLDATLALAALALWAGARRRVAVRADLARWLHGRSELTGEPAERIADRALSAYRRSLDGDPAGVP